MPTLRLKLPDQGVITHELTAALITVGRRPDNTIQVVDRSVSAHHAELICEDGHYRLHDLGSTNLSFVDGEAVTDFHLRQACKITFGTVECEFDPHGGEAGQRMSPAQLEKDLAFLRGENSELLGKIVAQQRQIDILSSARLVTKKTEVTPIASHNDALKAVTAERDDLRHLSTGLKLELENLREELAATVAERDAARQACELLQVEKVSRGREIQDLRRQADSGAAPAEAREAAPAPAPTMVAAPLEGRVASSPNSASAAPTATFSSTEPVTMPVDTGDTQKIELPLPARFQVVLDALRPMMMALERLSKNAADKSALAELSAYAGRLVETTNALGPHPIGRLGLSMEALLHDVVHRAEQPEPGQVRTLHQAAELIARLLDSSQINRVQHLPHPKVLAVDDDTDLLQTLRATLELAQLPTTACADGNAATALLASNDFDLILLDVTLPGIDGPTLCNQIRENDRHRKTPVIFLTVADTLDHRAQASLSGGNDFLPKPFNTAELAVKAETWIWKNRFGLL
jgi:CheY-like chemotaxis protein